VIFAATTADGYEWLECDIEDAQKIFEFTGVPLAADWKPIRVRRISQAKWQNAHPIGFSIAPAIQADDASFSRCGALIVFSDLRRAAAPSSR
jgi:hypothetical protein